MVTGSWSATAAPTSTSAPDPTEYGDGTGWGGAVGWLLFAGVVTSVPLLLFAAAARRLRLIELGLMQYIAPILQFALGVFWFHEDMPPERWVGFTLVWVALVVFTVEALHHRRRQLRLVAESSAV